MKVCEIFESIQGESSYAGRLCTFVRMTGCNLRCYYCDTTYAFTEGSEMSEQKIISKIKSIGFSLVEITGGEPLLQKDVFNLIKKLLDYGYTVLIETNGSLSIKDVDRRAIVILDLKTPGSGMAEKMDFTNINYIKNNDEIKFVITNRSDYEWTKEVINHYDLIRKTNVLLSPVYDLPAKYLAKWMIEDRIQARLNIQIHKYIFGPNVRGK